MQNRYTGDIGDFGKFLLLKHLFPHDTITTIWYLYPDETHNTDGSHTVEEGNVRLYRNCHTLDPLMSELFNTIHQENLRHVELFETYPVLRNGRYFKESIVGKGDEYRRGWLERALAFTEKNHSSVVCLDPDNGIEPASVAKLSYIKQSKYATYTEIEHFFVLECVQHLVIYQHFHRQCSHVAQMKEAKARFETLYQGRAVVTIIRHNPVQARFYILLSKPEYSLNTLSSLEELRYATKAFFSVLRGVNEY
ncbi:hypothetical protein [Sulfuricurvum sp.]|uniref:hypothetical protein n=1 Tax=Sulfuricurvum sp. TaxID=2025608 RepID=UPI0026242715|nr:hypothetical protein [Sulfuricurvum sp.]MDD3596151.1 hypothetical protein [Sulfuricurvum sp.]